MTLGLLLVSEPANRHTHTITIQYRNVTFLTRRLPRGGGENPPPPPRFFSNLEKTGENFVKIFFLPEPNSFPDILKKKSCKSVKRLGHSNYVLEVYGGGVIFHTSHFFYLLVDQGGGDFDPPPVEFLFTDRF